MMRSRTVENCLKTLPEGGPCRGGGKLIQFPRKMSEDTRIRCIPVHKMMLRRILEEIEEAGETNSTACDPIQEKCLNPQRIIELSPRRRAKATATNQESGEKP